MLKLGCHVGMSGKEMMLGSVKDAVSFGANTFMLYTGAPQNTRRKEVSELRIEEAHALMAEHGIDEFVVHAPYIINLANTVNPATYEIAVEFLAKGRLIVQQRWGHRRSFYILAHMWERVWILELQAS